MKKRPNDLVSIKPEVPFEGTLKNDQATITAIMVPFKTIDRLGKLLRFMNEHPPLAMFHAEIQAVANEFADAIDSAENAAKKLLPVTRRKG